MILKRVCRIVLRRLLATMPSVEEHPIQETPQLHMVVESVPDSPKKAKVDEHHHATHKIKTDEHEYIRLVETVLEKGVSKQDRTGTGTISMFGMQARYSLREGTVPLLTTKKVFWDGIVKELLWFIKGSTDSKQLSRQNVKIWDGNGSRQFLDKSGFTEREEGDLGPVYGFQWRHYGAEYKTCNDDYTGQGIDQLAECIRMIRENPDSRRIIMTAWNPTDVPNMALPLVTVWSSSTSAMVNCPASCIRGVAILSGLGVPFNIASYALLTHMIAHVTGLKAGDFVHSLGDAHIYVNHVDGLKQQILRQPRGFPTIRFHRPVTSIDEFGCDDIELVGYNPHPIIKLPFSA